MKINTLNDLKNNPIIIKLNEQQSDYDNKDEVLLKGNFTRSPFHAIQFLIVYAGLDEEQRLFALNKLDNKNIKITILLNTTYRGLKIKIPIL